MSIYTQLSGSLIYGYIQKYYYSYNHTLPNVLQAGIAKNQLDRCFWQKMWQFFAINLESG